MKVKTEEVIQDFYKELNHFLSTDKINAKEDEFTYIKPLGDGQAIIARLVNEESGRTVKIDVNDSVFFAEKSEDTLDIFGG